MALTAEQIKKIKEYRQQQESQDSTYIPPSQMVANMDKAQEVESRKQSFLSRIKSNVGERFGMIEETMQEAGEARAEEQGSFLGKGLSMARDLVSTAIPGPIGEAARFIPTSREGITPGEERIRVGGDIAGMAGDVIGAAAQPAIEKIAQQEWAKPVFSALASGMETYEEWKNENELNKRTGEVLEGVFNLSDIVGASAAGKTLTKTGLRTAKGLAETGAEKTMVLTTKTADKIFGNKRLNEVLNNRTEGIKEFGKDTGRYVTSQITGLAPDTIETLIKNPGKFEAAQLEGLTRMSLAKKVEESLNKRLDELSELGKEYESIRQLGNSVILPEGGYKSFLENEFKIKVDGSKITSMPETVPMSKQDINAIEEFLEIFGDSDTFNANEFLNGRRMLDNISRYDRGKTDASRNVSRKLRQFHDAAGKEQLPGLKELDAQFGPEADILNSVRKEILDKDGNLNDNALNRLATITGAGKDLKLQKIKKIYPDIEDEAKILQALKDVEWAQGRTVGSYVRSGMVAGGIVTMNPALIVGAIIAQPKVAVKLLKKFGKFTDKANQAKIIEKIKNGIPLNSFESKAVSEAIQRAAERIGSGAGVGTIEGIEQQVEEITE